MTRIYAARGNRRTVQAPCGRSITQLSGHGTANNLGGYLVTQDAKSYDEGSCNGGCNRYGKQLKNR